MASLTGFCCCIFGGNKEAVIVLFLNDISAAIFFSEGIWGRESLSSLMLLQNRGLLIIYFLLFVLLKPASQKQSLGLNVFFELEVHTVCTPKSLHFVHLERVECSLQNCNEGHTNIKKYLFSFL